MKTKKNSNPQGKVWARRGQYENALTKTDIRNRPLELSWVDIPWGGIEGETVIKRIFFKDMPASLGLKLRDDSVPVGEKIPLMFDLLATLIVNPETAEPIMTADEWGEQDLGFINNVSKWVLGIQYVAPEEEQGEVEGETEGAIEAQADPNPFAETDG